MPVEVEKYRFSAFWLRSSVVSVLISLIAGSRLLVDIFDQMYFCLLESGSKLASPSPRIALVLALPPGAVHFPLGNKQ